MVTRNFWPTSKLNKFVIYKIYEVNTHIMI